MEFHAAGSGAAPDGTHHSGAPHFKDFDILLLTTAGSAVYRFNGQSMHLRPGQILLMPRGIDWHSWRVSDPAGWRVRWLRVRLGTGEEELFDYPRQANGASLVTAAPVLIERLCPLLDRLAELHMHPTGEAPVLRDCLARAALHELRSFHGPAERPHDPACARALAHIDRHLTDPDLGLDDLVAASGCGRSAFAKRFTASMGLPPMHYLQEQRLQLAARRLQADKDAVTAIATGVGFASAQYFATCFRRRFGCSPSRFRREHLDASR